MTDKKKSDNTPYWCTCADDPKTCLGCGIDKLVFQVLGELGKKFLENRTYKLRKK